MFSVDGEKAQSSGHSHHNQTECCWPGHQSGLWRALEWGSGGQNPGQNRKVGPCSEVTSGSRVLHISMGHSERGVHHAGVAEKLGAFPSAPFLLMEPQGRKAPHPRGHYFSLRLRVFPDIEEGLGGPISGNHRRAGFLCRWEAAGGEWAGDGGEWQGQSQDWANWEDECSNTVSGCYSAGVFCSLAPQAGRAAGKSGNGEEVGRGTGHSGEAFGSQLDKRNQERRRAITTIRCVSGPGLWIRMWPMGVEGSWDEAVQAASVWVSPL